MKVSRIFISFVIALLLFMFSINVYDISIKDRFYANTEMYHESNLFIESDNGFNNEDIINTLIETAEDLEVTIHVPYGSQEELIHFIHTTDDHIIDSFILEGNKLIDFRAHQVYASNSLDKEFRIFKPTQNGSLTVYPLLAYDMYDFNIKGEYDILSKDEQNIERFKEEISQKLKTYDLIFNDVGYDSQSTSIFQNLHLEVKDVSLLISLEVLLALSIVYIVVRETKKVMILRFEGESTRGVFRKLIGKKSLYYFLIWPLIFLVLFTFIFSIKKSLFIHPELFYLLAKYFIILKLIDVLFLALYYWIFSRITINEGVKGRNSFKILSSSLYILKILFIVIAMVPFKNALNTIADVIKGEQYYYEVKPYMENKYVAEGSYAGDAANEIGKEAFIPLIKQELFDKHNGFEYFDHIIGDIENGFLDKQIVVSRSYFDRVGLQHEAIANNSVIVSEEKFCERFYQAQSDLVCVYDTSLFENLISYSPHPSSDYPIKGYYPNYKHQNVPYILFLNDDEMITRILFDNEHGLEAAQKVLDDLYLKYDIKPVYIVNSLNELIEQDRKVMHSFFLKALISVCSLVITYMFLASISSKVEGIYKHDRYYLEIVEGKSEASFIFRNLLQQLPIYVMILILGYVLKLDLYVLLIIVTLILSSDIAVFKFFLKRLENGEDTL